MDFVFLDANVIIRDYRLDSGAFRLLLAEADRDKIWVWIPITVLLEVWAKYKEETDSISADLHKIRHKIQRLGLEEDSIDDLLEQLTDEPNSYFEWLLDKLGATSNIVKSKFPKVTHEELMRRIIFRRKPIKPNGTGYQDALIWELILEVIAEGPEIEIFFITQNTRDFTTTDDGSTLAPDLVEDLAEHGIKPSRVKLFPTLKDYVDARLRLARESFELASEIFADDSDNVDMLYELLTEVVPELLPETEIEFTLPTGFRNPILDQILELTYPTILDAYDISKDLMQVEIAIGIDSAVKATLDSADLDEVPNESLIDSTIDPNGRETTALIKMRVGAKLEFTYRLPSGPIANVRLLHASAPLASDLQESGPEEESSAED